VKVLNKIFHRFDELVNKHGLEKIKTMGDGYLAVSGVPDPDTNHCQKAINFALEVRKEIEKFNNETGLSINARIGLESGPLVAGVIGSSKFIYDIWGDSVNTASRMESTGTPGKIQITENVKNELEKQTTNLQFEKREAFEVKGKGTMQTYFIEKETIEG
jgi:class 3 adenylate cyclase